jgi:hypothetical protein
MSLAGPWTVERNIFIFGILLAVDPKVSGSIPSVSRFSEKQRVSNEVHSASWGQLRCYLKEKIAVPVYKTEISDRGNPLRWSRDTLYPQKLALTSPTSGVRSFGIVRSRTKATECSFSLGWCLVNMNIELSKETPFKWTPKQKMVIFPKTSSTVLIKFKKCMCNTRNKIARIYNDWLRTGRLRGRNSSPDRGKIFLLSTSSRPVLGPTQPPIQWVPCVKWLGR